MAGFAAIFAAVILKARSAAAAVPYLNDLDSRTAAKRTHRYAFKGRRIKSVLFLIFLKIIKYFSTVRTTVHLLCSSHITLDKQSVIL